MKRRRVRVCCDNSTRLPKAFYWRGRWRRVVRVWDAWRETSRWWLNEPPLDLVRVEAAGLYLLARPVGTQQWYLEGEED
jgi:hypothetical protein